MKAVKLLKPYKHYNEGEIVGFGGEVNQKLIDAGVAEAIAAVKPDAKKSAAGNKSAADTTKSDAANTGADSGDGAGQGDSLPPGGE